MAKEEERRERERERRRDERRVVLLYFNKIVRLPLVKPSWTLRRCFGCVGKGEGIREEGKGKEEEKKRVIDATKNLPLIVLRHDSETSLGHSLLDGEEVGLGCVAHERTLLQVKSQLVNLRHPCLCKRG
jgi:hypothetical protein